MDRFWLVWKEGGGAPARKHETERGARDEAERLAKMHGGVFYVVKAIAAARRDDRVLWSDVEVF